MSEKAKPGRPAPRRKAERAASSSANEADRTLAGWLDESSPGPRQQHYVLKLYVTGLTTRSRQAIERVRDVCELHLRGRYELEVVDIHQLPALAKDEQIVATPTLIKVLPSPLRRFIGNLANVEKVLFGLDLREKTS